MNYQVKVAHLPVFVSEMEALCSKMAEDGYILRATAGQMGVFYRESAPQDFSEQDRTAKPEGVPASASMPQPDAKPPQSIPPDPPPPQVKLSNKELKNQFRRR